MNLQAEGRVYPAVELVIDPDRVRAFGLAVLAPEGLGVPPTFATAAEFAAFPAIISDPDLGLDFSRVVHGDQRFTFTRPIVAGDELTAQLTVTSVKSLGGNDMVTSESVITDAHGEHVVTATSTLVVRAEA